jgi:NADH oxidase (H2O2-forming)
MQGGMLVDDHMRTSAESVYAAGDCVEMKRGDSTLSARLHSASTVMGVVAGTNAAGGNSAAQVSGAISQTIFGVDVCGAGLDVEQARSAGLDPIEVTTSSSEPEDPFGSEEVFCTMIVDRSSLEVCGISVIGSGARSHSDALSLIVSSRMKVADLAYLETAYSPKNSSGQSPIALTARRAIKLIGSPP